MSACVALEQQLKVGKSTWQDSPGTGYERNLDEVQNLVRPGQWTNVQVIDFRTGDVRHSLADIDQARRVIGPWPTHRACEGLRESMNCYVHFLGTREYATVT
jgi:hypothetical protein